MESSRESFKGTQSVGCGGLLCFCHPLAVGAVGVNRWSSEVLVKSSLAVVRSSEVLVRIRGVRWGRVQWRVFVQVSIIDLIS